ncbi:NAD-dependent epimerase [Enterobacter asburiae]|uniref:NAD-dependent epimerase n=1 Tax=Enterobacter asburiae TaxID=61645 RepID=A0A376FA04_ENTAS|nr:NAD-dependent epimerase [Enterobacter asburiae]
MTWISGDAQNAEQVEAAASECSVIVHAVNPPGYRNWEQLVLPMLHNTINAAERNGALIVLPGTIYNYGPDAFPLLREDSPQDPITRKGAIRVQMENALSAYAQRGGKVLILRAGDFFGPLAGNNWFSQGLVKPGHPPKVIKNPGKPAQDISGLICRMSPKPLRHCWRGGMNSKRFPVSICVVTGILMGQR